MAEDGGVCSEQRYSFVCMSTYLCLKTDYNVNKHVIMDLLSRMLLKREMMNVMDLYTCTCFDNCCTIHNRLIIEFCRNCFSVKAEWESGGSSGNRLLQTVCRCSLATLLKHTGLQNEACWQDRSVT